VPKLTHKEVDDEVRKILEPPQQQMNGKDIFNRLMAKVKGNNGRQ
jgi:hypothetical protein